MIRSLVRTGHLFSHRQHRHIFNSKFNIAFGYPRANTCSKCNPYTAKLSYFQASLLKLPASEIRETKKLEQEIKTMETINRVNKLKAKTF